MRRIALLLLALFLTPVCGRAEELPLQARIRQARGRVLPALVNLEVVQRRSPGLGSGRTIAAGSGVIVSPDGYVLTNYHVAREAVRIQATTNDGKTYRARVVSHDYPTDLSVLKLETDQPLAYAELERSKSPEVGTYVLAMGNPLRLSSSVTLGVVSNTDRVASANDLGEVDLGEGKVAGLYTRWLQHDALILPGNSGGPLVDLEGKIVGINELGGRGVGFAIPSTLAAQVFDQVRLEGRVVRGYLGLRVMPVKPLGLPTGVLVSHIEPGSPAESAGLEPGDVLLDLDGQEVKALHQRDLPDFYQLVAAHRPTTLVELRYRRNGQTQTTTARLAELTFEPERELSQLGLTVRELTRRERLSLGLGQRRGLLVTELRQGYPLAETTRAVHLGDVLMALDLKPTPTYHDLVEAAPGLKGEFVVTVFRDGLTFNTVARSRPQSLQAQGLPELPKAWLGVGFEPLTADVARALGQPEMRGMMVTRLPKGPAVEAGLLETDIIVAIDGQKAGSDIEVFQSMLASREPGTQVALELYRPGTGRLDKLVKLGSSPEKVASNALYRSLNLDFSLRPVDELDRIDHPTLADHSGLLVADVPRGGWADLAGLREGDLVEKVDNRPLADLTSFEDLDRLLRQQRPERVTLLVRRGARTHILFLEPAWDAPKGDNV
ncbi:MAG: PDZ domain-containing protein [Candidatus Eremiobacteraeota bacterium]|nr:PDZ domain-containing protein [Candidatus Eremiobacteraeota bacterium]